MKRILVSLLAVAVFVGASGVGLAQVSPGGAMTPVVTVAVSSYDDVKSDLGFVATLGGNPGLAQQLDMMVAAVTGGKGLVGLDTKRRWGGVVLTDGHALFSEIAMLPVTDLNRLMGAVGPMLGKSSDAGGGILKIEPQAGAALTETVYVKAQGGWAFVSGNPDTLASAPADPAKLLSAVDAKYDLAARASLQNVPPAIRQGMVGSLQLMASMAARPMPGESPEDAQIRAAMAQRGIGQLADLINDLDTVQLGLTIDQSTSSGYLEFDLTAKAGSKTAAQLQTPPGQTNFAGFDLPGAALTVNLASVLTDTDVAQAKATLAKARTSATKDLEANAEVDPATRDQAKQLLADVFDVFEKTVEGKKVDGGGVLVLKPGAITFAAGGFVADGAKLEKALKQLVSLVTQEEPSVAQLVKLDAETHQGVRFHKATIPVPEDEAKKFIGEVLDLVVGMGPQSVYVAGGRDAASTLKQVIDKSKAEAGKPVPAVRVAMAMTPVLQFAGQVAEDQQAKMAIAMVGGLMAQSGGKDHVTLTSQSIPNGMRTRLEIEQGILKAIGAASAMGGGPGGPPGGTPPGKNPF